MIFIVCKWIRFYQIKSIDFCILTYIFKQGGGNATSPIFRCNRKANDGFDFFTVGDDGILVLPAIFRRLDIVPANESM